MNRSIFSKAVPFGLLELDANGTVLYFKPEERERCDTSALEIVGQNFFSDIESVAEAREFQERVRNFKRSHAPADSFNFTFGFNQGCLQVRVLLARIHEHSVLGNAESLLVHIRPETSRIAA